MLPFCVRRRQRPALPMASHYSLCGSFPSAPFISICCLHVSGDSLVSLLGTRGTLKGQNEAAARGNVPVPVLAFENLRSAAMAVCVDCRPRHSRHINNALATITLQAAQ
jgi:hypothetical protein